MEAECQFLKRELEKKLTVCVFDDFTRQRLKSLTELLLIVQSSIRQSTHMEQVIQDYRNILVAVSDINQRDQLEQLLTNAEENCIDIVLKPLEILEKAYKDYIYQARAQTSSFGYLLAFVIYFYLIDRIKKTDRLLKNFGLFWEMYLDKINKLFNFSESIFLLSFAKSILCENYEIESSSDVLTVNPNNLLMYIIHLCSNLQDYLFVRDLSNIYNLFCNSKNLDYASGCLFDVTCTGMNINFENNQHLQQGKKFRINQLGLEQERMRRDKMVVFGKHRSCDVRFPEEDPALEDIVMCLYVDKNSIRLIDCSKNSHVAIKLKPHKKYPVRDEMIFNIATQTHLLIKKIDFQQSDEYEENPSASSSLEIQYLDGPFVGHEKTIRTPIVDSSSECQFLLGAGGAMVPDIFLRIEGFISRQHLKFHFSNMQWSIEDLDSKNGTFKVLKNANTFGTKEYSPIFTECKDKDQQNITIKILFYSFLIKKLVNDIPS